MKKIIIALLMLCALLLSVSCAKSGPRTVDMGKGKDSACFDSLRDDPKTLSLEVVQKGETKSFTFEGVYLKALLEKEGVKSYTKIEAVTSDLGNVDITESAGKDADVFLAWSESGVAETPMRVMPADAATNNLLIRNVTSIIITK